MRVAGVIRFLLTVALLQQMPQRILPVDEGPRDPEFAQFRRELLASAKRGDVTAIWEGTDQRNVWANANGERGLAALQREWDIAKSPDKFLHEFITVLELGGRFRNDGQTFVAPYVTTEFPPDPVADMTDYVVVLLPDVPVYAEAGTESSMIARVSHAVLPYNIAPPGWYSVRLPDGRRGFVEQRTARSPADAVATFHKIGRWRLIGFVAGFD